MKGLKIFMLIISLYSIISCHEKKQDNKNFEDFKKSKYFDEDRIKAAKYQVKHYGDVSAYSELTVYYSYNESMKEEFLPYLLFMVEKHKNYRYCTVVFDNFLEFYSDTKIQYDGTEESSILFLKNLEKLNTDQKNYLLYFVKLGVANNNLESINLLELLNRKGIGMKKNEIRADSLKSVLKKLKTAF